MISYVLLILIFLANNWDGSKTPTDGMLSNGCAIHFSQYDKSAMPGRVLADVTRAQFDIILACPGAKDSPHYLMRLDSGVSQHISPHPVDAVQIDRVD